MKYLKFNEMDFREYNLTMFPNSNGRVYFLEPVWENAAF
jgi:hypothetical protein